MNSCITTESLDSSEVVQLAKNAPAMIGSDYVKEVTTKRIFEWDPTDELSREWTLVKGGGTDVAANGQAYKKLPPVRHRIVAYDYGIKFNILRRLRQHGFKVTVVPATTAAESVLALKPHSPFLSPGPGDPGALEYLHRELKGLIGRGPIFRLCLWHHLLGFAYGGELTKFKFRYTWGNE